VINPSRFQLRPFHPDPGVSVEDVGVLRTSRAVQVTTNDNDARNRQNTYFKLLYVKIKVALKKINNIEI
jgi:hypothetical protein